MEEIKATGGGAAGEREILFFRVVAINASFMRRCFHVHGVYSLPP